MNLGKIATTMLATAALLAGTAAFAQDSSYKPGTVWNFSHIKIEPGQFENYMDFLSKTWKKGNEWGKKEGNVVSYHVFAVNNPREGEPDLILAPWSGITQEQFDTLNAIAPTRAAMDDLVAKAYPDARFVSTIVVREAAHA